MTCPLSGTGDGWLIELIHNRILDARGRGALDEANLWQSYRHAVERGHLDSLHFDNMMQPPERNPEDWARLALWGGWSNARS